LKGEERGGVILACVNGGNKVFHVENQGGRQEDDWAAKGSPRRRNRSHLKRVGAEGGSGRQRAYEEYLRIGRNTAEKRATSNLLSMFFDGDVARGKPIGRAEKETYTQIRPKKEEPEIKVRGQQKKGQSSAI